MKHNINKWNVLALAGILAIAIGGCSGDRVTEREQISEPVAEQTISATEISDKLAFSKADMVVEGYEWGPGITKLIVDCGLQAANVSTETLEVTMDIGENQWKADVKEAYLCDEEGNRTENDVSRYIALELAVNSQNSPFQVDFQNYFQIYWADCKVILTVKPDMEWTVGEQTYEGGSNWEYSFTQEDRILPDSENFEVDEFHYEAQNITLKRAWYAPKETEGGEPLIIWLHGGGEGGDDIQYALLGTEATALTRDEIQDYFVSEKSGGAWVLLVQTPTYWMDETGNRQENRYLHEGKQESYYTEALFAAIQDFTDNHPEIDKNRIYVGGASNGGYMTLNLMFEHGDFFAAYFPVCESYLNGNISDEMVEASTDRAIWFVQAEDDSIVPPDIAALPLYYRLVQAGAENIHFSLFPDVTGTDDPNGEYIGHYSWVYVFNNQVNRDFDLDKVKEDVDQIEISLEGETRGNLISKNNYVTAANCTETDNLFQWLSQQALVY